MKELQVKKILYLLHWDCGTQRPRLPQCDSQIGHTHISATHTEATPPSVQFTQRPHLCLIGTNSNVVGTGSNAVGIDANVVCTESDVVGTEK